MSIHHPAYPLPRFARCCVRLVASTQLRERLATRLCGRLMLASRSHRGVTCSIWHAGGARSTRAMGFLLLFGGCGGGAFFCARLSGAQLNETRRAIRTTALAARVGIHSRRSGACVKRSGLQNRARAKPLESRAWSKAYRRACGGMFVAGQGASDDAHGLLLRATAVRWACPGFIAPGPCRAVPHGPASTEPLESARWRPRDRSLDGAAKFEKAQRVVTTGPRHEHEPTTSRRSRHPPATARLLAFDNLSNAPEMQFFSDDGVSDKSIPAVIARSQLKVIGPHSSFRSRDRKPRRERCSARTCSTVRSAALRRACVSPHLMDAASQTTLWS